MFTFGLFLPHIGNAIPTHKIIFFGGVAQPPTSFSPQKKLVPETLPGPGQARTRKDSGHFTTASDMNVGDSHGKTAGKAAWKMLISARNHGNWYLSLATLLAKVTVLVMVDRFFWQKSSYLRLVKHYHSTRFFWFLQVQWHSPPGFMGMYRQTTWGKQHLLALPI